ncbi:MAG: SNF2-related protein [Acidobacteriota bacterium]
MVHLHQRSASHFREEDRQRGANYLADDRVELEVEGTRAKARVRGNDHPFYGVGLDWSAVGAGRKLHVYCQCERFAGGTLCKHIWATLLKLGEEFPEIEPEGRERIGITKDRAARWKELGPPVEPSKDNSSRQPRRQRGRKARRRRSRSSWQSTLVGIRDNVRRRARTRPAGRQPPPLIPLLLLNAAASTAAGAPVVDLFGRRETAEGKLSKLKRANLTPDEIQALLHLDEDEATPPGIVAALPPEAPRQQGRNRRGKSRSKGQSLQTLQLAWEVCDDVLQRLARKGILAYWDGRSLADPQEIVWDDGEPWTFTLQLEHAAADRTRIRGLLCRGEESVPMSRVGLMIAPNEDDVSPFALIVVDEKLGHLSLDSKGTLPWIEALSDSGEIVFPEEELEDALSLLLDMPHLPNLNAPEELLQGNADVEPVPRLVLQPEDAPAWMNPQLQASLTFRYGDLDIDAADPRSAIVDWDEQLFARRDLEFEREALVRLLELGLQPIAGGKGDGLELEPSQLPLVAEPLLLDGWEVEAHGASIRPPKMPQIRVESGMDWFEVSGEVDWDGDPIDLSQVLEAIQRGDRTIELQDGSRGLLPESWMSSYESLAKLAQDSDDGSLRFLPSQALLVDALLAATPPQIDTSFAELREKLQTFERIEPKKEPRGFGGELRSYQRTGLGWLCFLREFGLGGVLADDMGLGKTVQALALLRSYRTPKKTSGLPYLVVAPRSLVYNWMDEASRFTPTLKCVEYAGRDREELRKKFDKYDIIVTTYGTLRRDISYLSSVEFDTVILDEAQAIKNPESQTAKACRLLRGRNRLALTGTPIENHLGELGSIFEFLNPGLLGRLPALDVLASGREASQRELALVAKGIRPFILRRTKEQVLPDLPEKTEQVLVCELTPEQRELYDQLRQGYRENLLQQVEESGVGGSAMQVLEALLRLRQIACHPGLVDKKFRDVGSAKLEQLYEQIREVLSEGHKVIIFSQFTKLLAIVREHFDAQGMPYAYLDGQTKNRGEIVDHFQTDPDCNAFLISLKAGGVGLNLTAASYVFLLDPWWNPAVEAQAIDRTHRIGQTMPVFAYRLIAKDTVEEKMIELQKSKRKLADAILDGGEGQTTLKDLTADDLSMLLS